MIALITASTDLITDHTTTISLLVTFFATLRLFINCTCLHQRNTSSPEIMRKSLDSSLSWTWLCLVLVGGLLGPTSCRAFIFPRASWTRPHYVLHMVDPWNEKQSVPIVFSDSQPLRINGANSTAADVSQFGKSVSLKDKQDVTGFRRRNLVVAVMAISFSLGQYAWQFTHPVTPVSLLMQMTQESSAPQVIGTNNKPTLVDFWAPWCENCRVMAPTLRALHDDYKDQINFVTINADATDRNPWPLINAFGVDAIPHLALVNAQGDVETALIGIVPKSILSADLDVLLRNAGLDCPPTTAGSNMNSLESSTALMCTDRKELPYKMLDAFQGKPEQRRVRFDK